MAKNIYDILWKRVLEDVFADLLRRVFTNADDLFDFDKGFIFLDTELPQLFPDFNSRAAKRIDKLVLGYLKSGGQALFYGHVEVEGGHRSDFGRRMFIYNTRLADKYKCQVWSFAIYTGGRGSYRPGKYENDFLGTRICFEFESLKIMDFEGSEDELEKSNNAFDAVILCVLLALKKGNVLEDNLLQLKIALAKKLLMKKFSKKMIKSLLQFLTHYIRFEKQETNHTFEQVIYNQTKRMGILESLPEILYLSAKEDGIIQGKAVGKAEGKAEERQIKDTIFVTNLLDKTTFSVAKIASLAGVKEDFVISIKNRLSNTH